MRLFAERGYHATTVADVADAAEVSSMTVFRHFPTKEALVLADDYDPTIAARIAARPAGEPLLRRIGWSLVEGVAELSADEFDLVLARVRLVHATPALRARHWETQFQTAQAIVDGLSDGLDDDEVFRVRVTAEVCLAAAGVAFFRWAEADGRADLTALMEQALSVVVGEAHP
ncbi:MAG: TetR family transcriptional regulator [Streptosporangiales bacterium]|nr:TetR family transcriptional regulator [Streptosporangiales bacterium]